MTYLSETSYLIDDKAFDVEKAVSVTARTVGQWCSHYAAGIILPFRKVKKWQEAGRLPDDAADKAAFISGLVRRLFEDSSAPLFKLFLDTQPIETGNSSERFPKFDHHDDQCCWQLDLTEQEFAELQQAWREHGLPEDLFYPQAKAGEKVESHLHNENTPGRAKLPVKRLLVSLVIALLFVLSSLFWAGDTADSHADLSRIELGWPRTFVVQDFSGLDPPAYWFPYKVSFGVPLEIPTDFSTINFFANWLIVTAVLLVILSAIARLPRRKNQPST